MDDEDNIIKECLTYFGRALYSAQIVEKGVLNIILFSQIQNITKDRYDELLAEKSQLTFGKIKQEITAMPFCDEKLTDALNKFHANRDWLAHNYWWDRSIELNRRDSRQKILIELEELYAEFEKLNDAIQEHLEIIMKKNGIDFNEIVAEFYGLEETPKTIEIRKLTKNETLLGIYSFETFPGSQMPIFKLEDKTYWCLCEIGLSYFPNIANEEKLIPLEKTKGIFPVVQFNPRPRITVEGEYELDIKKNGLYMKVNRTIDGNKAFYKWSIKKK